MPCAQIAFAQTEIKKIEDTTLERMMEADDLAAALKKAEAVAAPYVRVAPAPTQPFMPAPSPAVIRNPAKPWAR